MESCGYSILPVRPVTGKFWHVPSEFCSLRSHVIGPISAESSRLPSHGSHHSCLLPRCGTYTTCGCQKPKCHLPASCPIPGLRTGSFIHPELPAHLLFCIWGKQRRVRLRAPASVQLDMQSGGRQAAGKEAGMQAAVQAEQPWSPEDVPTQQSAALYSLFIVHTLL